MSGNYGQIFTINLFLAWNKLFPCKKTNKKTQTTPPPHPPKKKEKKKKKKKKRLKNSIFLSVVAKNDN